MHIQFCPRPPVQFPKTKNSRTPSFVTFHPWLAGQCVVVRWRENKSFYDILSTSEETLSHAGLGAGKFYLIYASIPPLAVATTAFFKPFCSPPRIALKKILRQIFLSLNCLLKGYLIHLDAVHWVLFPSQYAVQRQFFGFVSLLLRVSLSYTMACCSYFTLLCHVAQQSI